MEKKIQQRIKELKAELQFTQKQIDALSNNLNKLTRRTIEINSVIKELDILLKKDNKENTKSKD